MGLICLVIIGVCGFPHRIAPADPEKGEGLLGAVSPRAHRPLSRLHGSPSGTCSRAMLVPHAVRPQRSPHARHALAALGVRMRGASPRDKGPEAPAEDERARGGPTPGIV